VVKLTHEVQSVYRVQEYGAAPTIDGVVTVGLRRFRDDGGAMLELLRFGEKRPPGLEGFEPAQINYSTVEPGSIKAFHVHLRQTDVWFVPPEDRILLVLVDVREESSTAGRQVRMLLGDGQPELVRIPPGWPTAAAIWAGSRLASSIFRTSRSCPTRSTATRGACRGIWSGLTSGRSLASDRRVGSPRPPANGVAASVCFPYPGQVVFFAFAADYLR
jgi:hypothetical protein